MGRPFVRTRRLVIIAPSRHRLVSDPGAIGSAPGTGDPINELFSFCARRSCHARRARPAAAAELPLKQVILSNSGLAQFTHGGPVTGNSTIELPVRLDQVDDILKSLTVFDRAGAVGTVSLPGKTPLPELFRDLPFGPEALNSSPDLLNALVGSEIEISGAGHRQGPRVPRRARAGRPAE